MINPANSFWVDCFEDTNSLDITVSYNTGTKLKLSDASKDQLAPNKLRLI